MNNAAEAWLEREQSYAVMNYDGEADADDVRHIDRRHPVLISAPHAVNHHRFGASKRADRRTGGLAEVVGEATGAGVLTAAGRVSEWGSWEERTDGFVRILRREALRRTLILDLHGMGDRHGTDVCIGTGGESGPALRRAVGCLDRQFAGYRVSIDDPFDGSQWYTVLQYGRELGIAVIQLELSASLRDPRGNAAAAADVVARLSRTIECFARAA